MSTLRTDVVKNLADTFSINTPDIASAVDLANTADVSKGAAKIGRTNQVVASIVALKALLKTTASKDVFVSGYYVAGDGGGGHYYLDAADTTSADNGGTIIVATDGGRWKLTTPEEVRITQFGAKVDGITNDQAAIQGTLNNRSTLLGDGTTVIQSGLSMTTPGRLSGNGARSIIKAGASFPAAPILTLSPTVGQDPKGWIIEDFTLQNAGAATNGIMLDISTAGKFISKLRVSNVILDNQVSEYFVQLLNPVNVDGLFTSVFEDNWSMGGYFLDNVGDSVILQRNTTTGAGYAYYVNELNTASHIIIRDGNTTSASGVLVARGYNVLFDNMQMEVPVTFTGVNGAAFSATNALSTLITNLRITNSNINTQANTTLNCIFLNWTDNAQIDGNSLYCNPTTGNHIVIDTNARNTYIGLNKYFSSVDGTEITPKITDNGIGTMGVWKAATLATWTTLVDPTNGFPVAFFKGRDGLVQFRGNLTGAASTNGQTLFTLPVGFRPNAKTVTQATFANSAADSQALIQILATGEVQFVTAGATTVYLDGLTFSTR